MYERISGRIQGGNTYAIEPFATDGGGEVIEGKEVTIYSLRNKGAKGISETEKLFLDEIEKRFKTLPFSERWLSDLGSKEEVEQTLRNLNKRGFLHAYPVLLEVRKGMVSQFEHTVYVDDNKTDVLT